MSTLHEHLWSICKRLPSDYEPYGEQDRDNGDCSSGCKWYLPLEDQPADWGVCSNPKSPRCGLLTFEHMGGKECFEYYDEKCVECGEGAESYYMEDGKRKWACCKHLFLMWEKKEG